MHLAYHNYQRVMRCQEYGGDGLEDEFKYLQGALFLGDFYYRAPLKL